MTLLTLSRNSVWPMRVFVLPREVRQMREMSLGRALAILTVNIARVFVKKGGAVPKDILAVCFCQRGFGAAFSSNSLLAQNRQVWSHVLLIFQSGGFGVVFVNPLFAQFRPNLLHLPATVKSLRVMCLKNLSCLLPAGCFEGNNSVTAFMKFLGTKGRLAYVCVLALRPTTDPRHRHAPALW